MPVSDIEQAREWLFPAPCRSAISGAISLHLRPGAGN
jgi:hypothetical protein